jgi:hypothetical protein
VGPKLEAVVAAGERWEARYKAAALLRESSPEIARMTASQYAHLHRGLRLFRCVSMCLYVSLYIYHLRVPLPTSLLLGRFFSLPSGAIDADGRWLSSSASVMSLRHDWSDSSASSFSPWYRTLPTFGALVAHRVSCVVCVSCRWSCRWSCRVCRAVCVCRMCCRVCRRGIRPRRRRRFQVPLPFRLQVHVGGGVGVGFGLM